jgi:hypothetical protein
LSSPGCSSSRQALSAGSLPFAAWLVERIGSINTAVFTYSPSSLCLIAPVLKQISEGTLGQLLMRTALRQMDVPTRTS